MCICFVCRNGLLDDGSWYEISVIGGGRGLKIEEARICWFVCETGVSAFEAVETLRHTAAPPSCSVCASAF
jgi:hypothetical protein